MQKFRRNTLLVTVFALLAFVMVFSSLLVSGTPSAIAIDETRVVGSRATATASPVPEEPYLFINIYALNLRTGPGVEYAIIAVLEGGDAYEVLGHSPDAIWFLIDTEFGVGWVRGKYTLFRGELEDVPLVLPDEETELYGDLQGGLFFLHIFQPVYDEPNGERLGYLPGRYDYPVVGRTLSGAWLLLLSDEFGLVWIPASAGSFRGYFFNIPVIFPPYK
ncbi:MAG: SH3 domain-containing protein [Anaerolineae bacterium]|nr:SH3 domain-containing protein [Anaerolineae bacterium]